MFQEDLCEERFTVNRGRDAFIDQILEIIDPISDDDKEETITPTAVISQVLDSDLDSKIKELESKKNDNN